MKLVFLIGVLISVVQVFSTKSEAESGEVNFCDCLVYVKTDDVFAKDENLVSVFKWPNNQLKCSDWQSLLNCMSYCIDEFDLTTNNGDLNYVIPQLNVTLGEMYCHFLGRDSKDSPTGLFVRVGLCDEKAVFSGVLAKQNLCCSSGSHMNCTTPPSWEFKENSVPL